MDDNKDVFRTEKLENWVMDKVERWRDHYQCQLSREV
jgi:hypothetical protein